MKYPPQLTSELGKELMKMKNNGNESIDPTFAKDILVLAEDTRIAVRKSEVMNQGLQKHEIERQLQNVDNLHLNLRTGQQCIRDFFLCLKENLENWIDVYELFSFNMVYSTKCKSCSKRSQSEENQLYIEIDVPPNKSNLNEYVEEFLNGFCNVDYDCKDGCKQNNGAENRATLKNCKDTEFLIVMLRRVVQGEGGPEILQHTVNPGDALHIRYSIQILSQPNFKIDSYRDNSEETVQFNPVALIEHQGYMSEGGQTQGHYICDLQDKETGLWFRTNDNQKPVPISLNNVTNKPVVILYRKIN